MKLQFDPDQQYQKDAIFSVVQLFEGQPLARGQFEINSTAGSSTLIGLGFGNQLLLDDEAILANLRHVQEANGIPASDSLSGMHFSVDMETGTGKTYVYLRTLHELRIRYGFAKFAIVVPSVAIREGVKESIELMRDHFKELYGHPYDVTVYDSDRLSALRYYAGSNEMQILVLTLDAFNKPDVNVIFKPADRLSGRKPMDFIRAVCPIVVLDEPQNMESPNSKAAIGSLNPLCCLRYSATHRHLYNQVYRLDPVQACKLRLVKLIEVDSVTEVDQFNTPHISVKAVQASKRRIRARIELDVRGAKEVIRRTVVVDTPGIDLVHASGGREVYKGFVVDEINAAEGFVSFLNGTRLAVGESTGVHRDEVMQAQVRATVRAHFEKELRVRKLGRIMKVLSLLFIDRVANYAHGDGKIRRWFESAYTEISAEPQFAGLGLPPVAQVHGGYFAKDATGNAKDTSGGTEADEEIFELIMSDKERLLSPDVPLRFIFSHSALREGWDNPNVFQICTLNETRSDLKKRQEIGRGLRLPVDATGQRVMDDAINRLVIVANESYEDFARQLQQEIEEDCGVDFSQHIKRKRDRRTVALVEKWKENDEFLAIWERIKHRTRYSVSVSTDALVEQAAIRIRALAAVTPARIRREQIEVDVTERGVETRLVSVQESALAMSVESAPDAVGYLQKETELTRTTVARILIASGRVSDLWVNPQKFLDGCARAIRYTLRLMLVDGVKYERIAGAMYEMTLFESEEIEAYVSRLATARQSIYAEVECESDPERRFVSDLNERKDIVFFLKLPRWFTVDTPLGPYNPDWAIVKREESGERLYLVAETKGSSVQEDLRATEEGKIRCGRVHFDELGVSFRAPVVLASEI